MRFKGQVIEEPFACDPTNQLNQCELYFNVDPDDEAFTLENPDEYTRGKVLNQCKCSLGGEKENVGYCSSLLGTLKYQQAAAAMVIVKEESSCHTRDRFNLRAQKDDCGIGIKSDHFRFAVDKTYNVTYWPYI